MEEKNPQKRFEEDFNVAKKIITEGFKEHGSDGNTVWGRYHNPPSCLVESVCIEVSQIKRNGQIIDLLVKGFFDTKEPYNVENIRPFIDSENKKHIFWAYIEDEPGTKEIELVEYRNPFNISETIDERLQRFIGGLSYFDKNLRSYLIQNDIKETLLNQYGMENYRFDGKSLFASLVKNQTSVFQFQFDFEENEIYYSASFEKTGKTADSSIFTVSKEFHLRNTPLKLNCVPKTEGTTYMLSGHIANIYNDFCDSEKIEKTIDYLSSEIINLEDKC